MKILYIITKSGYGGAQTHVSQCASYMKSMGNIVAVMAHSSGNIGLEKEIRENEIEFFINDFLLNSFNPISGIFAMIEIDKVLKIFNPDIVSCHSSSAGFWGRLAIRNRVPVVFTAHGWGFTDGVSGQRAFVAKNAERIVAPLCKKIICVSINDNILARKYKIANYKKILTIHNGTDINKINDLPEFLPKIELFSKGSIPIVFSGRLDYPKKPEMLIDAFLLLSFSLQEKAEIFIIGDGEKKQLIAEIIKKNNLLKKVHLYDSSYPLNNILSLFKSIIKEKGYGIFVLTSDYEGLPRSILEAMSFGYAVIASRVGGVSEMVSSDIGFLVDRNDIKGLESKLESLLENPDKIIEFGINAKNKIQSDFTLEKMLKKTEEVYYSLLKI